MGSPVLLEHFFTDILIQEENSLGFVIGVKPLGMPGHGKHCERILKLVCRHVECPEGAQKLLVLGCGLCVDLVRSELNVPPG